MKVAILGDIHGNIEALKTVYHEAQGRTVDRIYHLGDLGGYAPFVNEVVDFLTDHNIVGVQGNYDDAVANDREHCGCRFEDPVQAEMARVSFAWTKKHTTPAAKGFMKSLPLELSFMCEGKIVKLFHATPHKSNLYWEQDRPDTFFQEMAEKAMANVLVYGHTHKPYEKRMNGTVFINAGSVGKPKDGDPRACLTIFDITRQGVRTEFVRVRYDAEKVAAAILLSGLPPYFADRLRKGI
jgi:putative phosphoesterase